MTAFLGADIADNLGERSEFALDCFGSDTDSISYFGSCSLWISANDGYYLLLSVG